jgi:hypothetical protein
MPRWSVYCVMQQSHENWTGFKKIYIPNFRSTDDLLSHYILSRNGDKLYILVALEKNSQSHLK